MIYLGAVSEGTRPLACNGPLVVGRHLLSEATGSADMLIRAHLQGRRIEDLVVVGVEQQIPHARAPFVPRSHTFKGIVEGDGDVGVLQVSPTVHVELADSVHVERWAKGLVQKLNGCDAGVVAKVVTQLIEGLDGQSDGITLSPLWCGSQLAGVVEAVLGSGSTVQIEHHLDAVLTSPANRLSNVVICAVHEGSATHNRPVANWQTNEVESNGLHLGEIVFGDPCVPMVTQTFGV